MRDSYCIHIRFLLCFSKFKFLIVVLIYCIFWANVFLELEQTLQEYGNHSLFWKERNLWLNPSRTVLSYGMPPQVREDEREECGGV